MSIERVKQLLQQLQVELRETTENIDPDTQDELKQIDDDIHRILAVKNLQQQDVYEGIKAMEYEFLTKHPVASGLLREMVNILSRAGI